MKSNFETGSCEVFEKNDEDFSANWRPVPGMPGWAWYVDGRWHEGNGGTRGGAAPRPLGPPSSDPAISAHAPEQGSPARFRGNPDGLSVESQRFHGCFPSWRKLLRPTRHRCRTLYPHAIIDRQSAGPWEAVMAGIVVRKWIVASRRRLRGFAGRLRTAGSRGGLAGACAGQPESP